MIDWSWELLTDQERAVLRRLAAHVGGFTLAAAEHVCAGDGVGRPEVADLVAALVDHSLAQRGEGDRYRLLESVAAYSAERLEQAGETDRTRRRHLRHHLSLCEQAEQGLRGPEQGEWLRRLDEEAANVRAALAWAVRSGADIDALRLTSALGWYWFLRGRHAEAVRSLRTALAAPGRDVPTPVRLGAQAWEAGFTLLTGENGHSTDGMGEISDLLARYGDADDPLGHARATWFLGFALCRSGTDLPTGERLVKEALGAFGPLGDGWGTAAAQSILATLALLRGDLAAVEHHGGESLTLFRALADAWGHSQAAYPLAALAEIAGDYAGAARLHREGLRLAEELHLWHEAVDRMVGLGRIALLEGDHVRAEDLHEQAARLAIERNYPAGEIHAALGLALAARRRGRYDLAERHLRRLLEWHESRAFEPGPALILAELGFLAEQRGDATAALARHGEGLAAARATGDPRAVALALEGLAGAHTLAGRPDKGAVLLGAASAVRESVEAPLPPAERGDVDRITQAVRTALGGAALAARFATGQAAGADGLAGLDLAWAASACGRPRRPA
ncbi:ATP-binding protein [Nonomuraea antimicrobica]